MNCAHAKFLYSDNKFVDNITEDVAILYLKITKFDWLTTQIPTSCYTDVSPRPMLMLHIKYKIL